MKTMLYKHGKGSVIWGIECQSKAFDDTLVDSMLADGWVKHPYDLAEPEPEPDDADTNKDGKVSFDEAKAYAAANNLDISGLHWKTAVAKVEEHMNGNDEHQG